MFWTELEEEIAALSAKAERSAVEEARLKEVTADFERISKKKTMWQNILSTGHVLTS